MLNTHHRSAFLLAAGLGTRMRPLSYDLPKPMMPLLGVPALARIVNQLAAWNVNRFLINAHHNPQPILDFARTHSRAGITIDLSFEPEVLGTGGALHRAAWFFNNQPFWFVNTDILAETQPDPFIHAFETTPRAIAAVWLHPVEGPRTVEIAPDHTVTTFKSPHPGATGTYTFCGLHLVAPRILDFIPPGFSSIITAYEQAMTQRFRIAGVAPKDALWLDIGTPQQYLRAHQILADRAVNPVPAPGPVTTPRRSAPRTRPPRTAHHQPDSSVFWPNATLAPNARVERSIVGTGAHVTGKLTDGMAIRAERLPAAEPVRKAMTLLRWPAAGTTALFLAPRGSNRSFIRIVRQNRSAIVMHYDPVARPENSHFASIARFLAAAHIPVPRILLDVPGQSLTVVQDLGDDSLEDLAPTLPPPTLARTYRRVLDALLTLHSINPNTARQANVTFQPPFSPRLYKWERDLFADRFLRDHLRLEPRLIRAVSRELARVATQLHALPPVPLHRDMQSSNVLIQRGRPFLIDFQGLRLGPALYDVASLLCDPYVELDATLQLELLHYYATRAPAGHASIPAFWLAAIERLAQALGAFARLAAAPGTARFAARIEPGIRMMNRALSAINGLPALQQALSTPKSA